MMSCEELAWLSVSIVELVKAGVTCQWKSLDPVMASSVFTGPSSSSGKCVLLSLRGGDGHSGCLSVQVGGWTKVDRQTGLEMLWFTSEQSLQPESSEERKRKLCHSVSTRAICLNLVSSWASPHRPAVTTVVPCQWLRHFICKIT